MKYFLSMSFFRVYAAWLLMPFLGFLFGVLAFSVNPIAIGVAVSSFIGVALLRKPTWNVELFLILSLVIAGLIPLFYSGDKILWGVSILGFMLLFGALYRQVTTPQIISSTPAFVWVALLFFVYAIVDSVFQFFSTEDFISAKEPIGGFKRYFQGWGLLFGLCWLDFSKTQINRWRTLVFFICCFLQIPTCLYERFIVAPSLDAYIASHVGLVPIDVVAGTFGSSMEGSGNSAEMAISLIMVFAFLLTRVKENILSAKKSFWLSILVLAPLFMGETKIVVIFFPLMIAVLYRKELLSRPHYAVAALIFGTLFTVITLNVYMIITKMTLDTLIFDTLEYNVYEAGYGDNYLNRTTVLTFWAQHQSSADPMAFLFGNGLGSSQEGKGISLGSGHIDIRYLNYGVGLTGLSVLLWELGTVSVALFLLMMLLAWRCANHLMAHSPDPAVRADAAAIQTAVFLFSIYPIYQKSLVGEISFQVMFTAMLGYLAWMYKYHVEHKR